jgi:hypothetical protein
MSYVIQNFADCNKKNNATPRFKFYFLLMNLDKFLLFFKLNTFLNITNRLNIFNIDYLFLFFKFFFSKYYTKLLKEFNLNLVGNYSSNLVKSCLFYIFYNLNSFFKFTNLKLTFFKINSKFILHSYFFSFKVLNVRINNNFYKNVFFLFMFINNFI